MGRVSDLRFPTPLRSFTVRRDAPESGDEEGRILQVTEAELSWYLGNFALIDKSVGPRKGAPRAWPAQVSGTQNKLCSALKEMNRGSRPGRVSICKPEIMEQPLALRAMGPTPKLVEKMGSGLRSS